jgi:hypothetical protein
MDDLNMDALKQYLPPAEGYLPYYMFTVRAPFPPLRFLVASNPAEISLPCRG